MFVYLGLHADFAFLDDTGADIPSAFVLDGLPLLRIGGPSPWWNPMISISTAEGVTHRRTIWILMQWMCAPGNMLTNLDFLQLATVNPGHLPGFFHSCFHIRLSVNDALPSSRPHRFLEPTNLITLSQARNMLRFARKRVVFVRMDSRSRPRDAEVLASTALYLVEHLADFYRLIGFHFRSLDPSFCTPPL